MSNNKWLIKTLSSIHANEPCKAIKNDVNYLKMWKYIHSGFFNKINMNGLTTYLGKKDMYLHVYVYVSRRKLEV